MLTGWTCAGALRHAPGFHASLHGDGPRVVVGWNETGTGTGTGRGTSSSQQTLHVLQLRPCTAELTSSSRTGPRPKSPAHVHCIDVHSSAYSQLAVGEALWSLARISLSEKHHGYSLIPNSLNCRDNVIYVCLCSVSDTTSALGSPSGGRTWNGNRLTYYLKMFTWFSSV